MAPANRASLTDTKKFLIAVLAVIGVFVVCYGAGLANVAVIGLGVAIAVLGPVLIVFANARGNARQMVFGTAHVHEVSALPATGDFGRCELELLITARGLNGVPVRVRDNAVPVPKWPDVGATLPVLVSVGDARKVRILWDQVRTHGEVASDDHRYDQYTTDVVEEAPEPADSPGYDHGPFPPTEDADEEYRAVDEYGRAEPYVPAEPYLEAEPFPQPTSPTQPQPTQPPAQPTPGERAGRPRPRPYRRRPAHDEAVPVSPSAYAMPEGGAAVATMAEPAESISDPIEPIDHLAEPTDATAEPADATAEPAERDAAAERDAEIDPADELEPDLLPNGAVAQFLAAGPQRAQPLIAEVSGVSITLIVADLGRSLRFYRDTLGLTELDSGPGSAVLASGDARVVLRRVADMPPVDRRVVHLNLEVADVYEAYDRLRSQGVEFVHRPRVVPQGEHLELCSATFRDPDGHAVALSSWELRR